MERRFHIYFELVFMWRMKSFLAECLVEMSKQRRETDGLSMLANPYLYAKQNWIQMINATTCVICNFV